MRSRRHPTGHERGGTDGRRHPELRRIRTLRPRIAHARRRLDAMGVDAVPRNRDQDAAQGHRDRAVDHPGQDGAGREAARSRARGDRADLDPGRQPRRPRRRGHRGQLRVAPRRQPARGVVTRTGACSSRSSASPTGSTTPRAAPTSPARPTRIESRRRCSRTRAANHGARRRRPREEAPRGDAGTRTVNRASAAPPGRSAPSHRAHCPPSPAGNRA